MVCRDQALALALCALGAGLLLSLVFSSGVLRGVLGLALIGLGAWLGCRRQA